MDISVSLNTQSRGFGRIRRQISAQPAVDVLERYDETGLAEEVNGFGFERRRTRAHNNTSAHVYSTTGGNLPQLRVLAQLARQDADFYKGCAFVEMTATYDRATDVTGCC